MSIACCCELEVAEHEQDTGNTQLQLDGLVGVNIGTPIRDDCRSLLDEAVEVLLPKERIAESVFGPGLAVLLSLQPEGHSVTNTMEEFSLCTFKHDESTQIPGRS